MANIFAKVEIPVDVAKGTMTHEKVLGNLSGSLLLRVAGGLVMTATVFPVSLYLRKDYLAFLALGPGGTPSTVTGYLKIKCLGLFALRNRYIPPPLSGDLKQREGHLNDLPQRRQPRPEIRGIAPQRQVTQKASKASYDRLAAAIEDMAMRSGGRFELGTSCFEKHCTGLFSTLPGKRTRLGEICHAHPVDGSLHLTLHPADAKVVLERLWGERHPLARDDFGGFFQRFVPRGFLMIYAPHDEEELAIVLRIIEAAAWFIEGHSIPSSSDDGRIRSVAKEQKMNCYPSAGS